MIRDVTSLLELVVIRVVVAIVVVVAVIVVAVVVVVSSRGGNWSCGSICSNSGSGGNTGGHWSCGSIVLVVVVVVIVVVVVVIVVFVVLVVVVLLTRHACCGHSSLGRGGRALVDRGRKNGLSLTFHFFLVHPGGMMSYLTTLNTPFSRLIYWKH